VLPDVSCECDDYFKGFFKIILFLFLFDLKVIDMIASFVYLFVRLDNFGKATFASELMNFFRYILTILFPNVTLKRTLYNLKIRDNEYCIKSLNSVLKTEYRKNTGFFAFEEPGVGMMLFLTVLQFVTLNCLLLGYEGRFYFSWRWLTKLKEIVIRSVYRRDDSSLVKVPFKLKSNVLKESERIDRADLGKLTKLEPLVIKNLYKVGHYFIDFLLKLGRK